MLCFFFLLYVFKASYSKNATGYAVVHCGGIGKDIALSIGRRGVKRLGKTATSMDTSTTANYARKIRNSFEFAPVNNYKKVEGARPHMRVERTIKTPQSRSSTLNEETFYESYLKFEARRALAAEKTDQANAVAMESLIACTKQATLANAANAESLITITKQLTLVAQAAVEKDLVLGAALARISNAGERVANASEAGLALATKTVPGIVTKAISALAAGALL